VLCNWRRADVARSELKYHANLVVDLVGLRQSLALLVLFERDPGKIPSAYQHLLLQSLLSQRTLLFSIATLNLLMRLLLDLSL
jgi:hypothetical protein